jgi:hypothetical protein
MEVRDLPIKDLKFSDYNPREITEHDFASLKRSIQEFGFVEPVVVNKDLEIIGGHMRVKAASELGMEVVPCMVVDLPPEKAKLLNLALNRISGRWDTDKLGQLITELTIAGANVDLSGFEGWELSYYNLGPDKETENVPNIEGVEPEKSTILIFVFNNEEDANKCSAFFSEGKQVKTIAGQKLLDFINNCGR